MSLANLVREQVWAIDREQPLADIQTMQQRLGASIAQPRFNTLLLAIFATVAIILAAIGIYGVMAYSVTERTHEIGIRMAMGARSWDVLRLIVGQGLRLSVAGVVIGLAGSFALGRVMSSLLFEVSETDPITFVVIPVMLVIVALAACFVPTRRALKVDPVVALRYE
jgi:putative ABC transport system permease protein